MGTIDSILQLQRDFAALAVEWRAVNQLYKEGVARYGTPEERKTRREEISGTLKDGNLSAGKRSAHPDELDARHNLRRGEGVGGRDKFIIVPGCPSCDAIAQRLGITELQEQRREIVRQDKEMYDLWTRRNELLEQGRPIIDDINQQARYIGLPSFEAKLDESGFITEASPVPDSIARGQSLLENGTSIVYGDTTAVLDGSERLVAYRSGGGDWTVMHAAAKPRIVTERGWYSVLRKSGTIELMIDQNGEFTNRYPHVHVVHDEGMNQIRVVASRSSTDHSPEEVLPGDASGNEVNAAIERAIHLL